MLKAFNRVVLPAPVPPETTQAMRALTAAARNFAISGASEPLASKSSICSEFTPKRRIDKVGPLIAKGGMMALTREPSGRRASTMGLISSIRRPSRPTIR